jgi:hypothetical protein
MQRENKKTGSALAYALVIMAIVMIILVSMLGYVSSQLKFSFNRAEKEKAFQIAEAGIYYYRWYIAHATYMMSPADENAFWQGGSALGVAPPYYEADFEGIGEYKIEVKAPDPGSTIIEVKSTGWTYKMPGVQRTVQVRFRRPSWSEYMYISDKFMNFGTGAEVYGKVYSNEGIRFDGLAHNVVSSKLAVFDDPNHTGANEFAVHTHKNPPPGSGVNDNFRPQEAPPTSPVPSRTDVFEAGRQFSVSPISFNSILMDIGFMKDESGCSTDPGPCAQSVIVGSHGVYFNNRRAGRRIILKSDGKFDVCTVYSYDSSTYSIASYRKNDDSGTCSSCSGQCLSNYTIPTNGVIFVDNNAWVEGTINNKRVSIVANGSISDMYLGFNNLLYTNSDGKDIIGLIAQRNITIVRDCQNSLVIDAALLAQSGRVWRDSYGSSYNKNSLTINGAIASYLQPYFNYGSDGFGTRTYNFDNNLLYFPPPYFPTGTEYSIDLWEEL